MGRGGGHTADTVGRGAAGASGSDGNGEQTQTSHSGMQSAREGDNTAIHSPRVAGLFLVQYVKWRPPPPTPHPTISLLSHLLPGGLLEKDGWVQGWRQARYRAGRGGAVGLDGELQKKKRGLA